MSACIKGSSMVHSFSPQPAITAPETQLWFKQYILDQPNTCTIGVQYYHRLLIENSALWTKKYLKSLENFEGQKNSSRNGPYLYQGRSNGLPTGHCPLFSIFPLFHPQQSARGPWTRVMDEEIGSHADEECITASPALRHLEVYVCLLKGRRESAPRIEMWSAAACCVCGGAETEGFGLVCAV